ncbi:hypothetical protein [Sphaerotilus sp.]|uniref:hypothetical protein n=1 Tax=Sphaerotilus sp. TaxID=2093942 RepID=UPI002ACEA6E9|nr:hypothetical protein [Sphaerotilus sp.]MDZ7855649.1 hypothetical protein [Sphaerotilus sp.]
MNRTLAAGERSGVAHAATVVVVALGLWGGAVQAAEFHLYLQCQGKVASRGIAHDAHLQLAMRDNNLTALIQKSNLLPVGERMKYVKTEVAYTLTYRTPQARSHIVRDWFSGQIFVWLPDLKRLAETRLSIDRQTAVLQGELLNAEGDLLGNLRMDCQPVSPDDLPAPKF